MSFKEKYLKYKQKYIDLKNQIGGQLADGVEGDLIDHTFLVHSINTRAPFGHRPKEDISDNDVNLYYNGEKPSTDFNPIVHDYPTLHTSMGTLVYPHGQNVWDFFDLAIINKMSNPKLKGKFYKINPFDTMILTDRVTIDKTSIIIISKKTIEDYVLWKNWVQKLKNLKIKVIEFDDSFNTDYFIGGYNNGKKQIEINKFWWGDRLVGDKLKNLQTEYMEMARIKKIFPNNIEKIKGIIETFIKYYNDKFLTVEENAQSIGTDITFEKFINYYNDIFLTVEENRNAQSIGTAIYLGINQNYHDFKFLQPSILASLMLKQSLRNTINETIKSNIPEGSFTYKNIYCTNDEAYTLFHSPNCLRKIRSTTDTNLPDFRREGEADDIISPPDKKSIDIQGEASVYGLHSASNMDKGTNIFKLKPTNTINDNINKIIQIIIQYESLLDRTSFKVTLPPIGNQIVDLLIENNLTLAGNRSQLIEIIDEFKKDRNEEIFKDKIKPLLITVLKPEITTVS